ncbi:MAG: hypothetical protein Q4E99_03945 [Bacillota bacterium]|nr:hypothetical protein [Bacillota bacterium]
MKFHDALLLIITMFLVFILVFYASTIETINTKMNSLQCTVQQIETTVTEKCQETESKCQRMTDTCISVIANRTWE